MPPKGNSRKRKKKDWAALVGTRAFSGRPRKQVKVATGQTAVSRRTTGFVSGKGLTKIGRNKDITQRNLNAAAEAEAASGSGARIQRELADGLRRYKRAGMGQDVTMSLISPGSLSLAHNVESQRAFSAAATIADLGGMPAPGLRAMHMSRNHILADSSIASIAHEAMSNYDPADARHVNALGELFRALTGHDGQGNRYLADFQAAHTVLTGAERPDRGILGLHDLIDAVAVSPNNMVIADDARNTNQAARFDPVMDRRGRLNAASERIQGAVIGLRFAGLISYPLMESVLALALRTSDHRYETSNTVRPVHQEDLAAGYEGRNVKRGRESDLDPPDDEKRRDDEEADGGYSSFDEDDDEEADGGYGSFDEDDEEQGDWGYGAFGGDDFKQGDWGYGALGGDDFKQGDWGYGAFGGDDFKQGDWGYGAFGGDDFKQGDWELPALDFSALFGSSGGESKQSDPVMEALAPDNIDDFLRQQGRADGSASLAALRAQFDEGRATRVRDNCLIHTLAQLAADNRDVVVDCDQIRADMDLPKRDLDIHALDQGWALAQHYNLHVVVHRLGVDGEVTQDPFGVYPAGARQVHVLQFGAHFIPLWPKPAPAADNGPADMD